jgi:hypothetical protein
MAYPNFKNGPKNGLGPLGVKTSWLLHINKGPDAPTQYMPCTYSINVHPQCLHHSPQDLNTDVVAPSLCTN